MPKRSAVEFFDLSPYPFTTYGRRWLPKFREACHEISCNHRFSLLQNEISWTAGPHLGDDKHMQGQENHGQQGVLVEKLRCSENRFRTIFEYSNDAIFVVDLDQQRYLDVNAKACSMLGYTREELLAKNVQDIHPHEMQRVEQFTKGVRHQGWGSSSELSCLTKDGTYLAAEVSGAIIELDGRTCMIASVRDISERRRLVAERDYLREKVNSEEGSCPLVGSSPALQQVCQEIQRVAPTDASVLISGESGTGKELVARSIHRSSLRHAEPLIRVNCASIPAELFESEFFGHVKGAFTSADRDRAGRFELADGGTLFLDEVGEIPYGLQGKLLRVLQEGEMERVGDTKTKKVNVRIISATNRDLEAEIQAGTFRQDLYYRLNTFPIIVPPLRERREDVAQLADVFLADLRDRMGRPNLKFAAGEAQRMQNYDWPGNVRELQNAIERGAILAREEIVSLELPIAASERMLELPVVNLNAANLTLKDVERLEIEVIEHALRSSAGRIYGLEGAAHKLGIKATTLASRIKKKGIEVNG